MSYLDRSETKSISPPKRPRGGYDPSKFEKGRFYGIISETGRFYVYDTLMYRIYFKDKYVGEPFNLLPSRTIIKILLAEGVTTSEIEAYDINMSRLKMVEYLNTKSPMLDPETYDDYTDEELEFMCKWYLLRIKVSTMADILQTHFREEGTLVDKYSASDEKGLNLRSSYEDIWQEALRLGMVNISYPGDEIANKISTKKSMFIQLNKYSEVSELDKVRIRNRLANKIKEYIDEEENEEDDGEEDITIDQDFILKQLWKVARAYGIIKSNMPYIEGIESYISIPYLVKFIQEYPTSGSERRSEIRSSIKRDISRFYRNQTEEGD